MRQEPRRNDERGRLSSKIACSVGWIGLTAFCSATALADTSTSINAAWLVQQAIPLAGSIVDARHIADKSGEHILVLNRKAGPSPSAPKSGRTEYLQLNAAYYGRTPSGWKSEWTIRDAVDCPGLDAAADFFAKAVTYTDLNGDGRVEVTVPYHLFCGGGVDPHTVKVILRDGATKLAIRGESLVQLPGQQAFGGEHQYDKALLKAGMRKYKQHLDTVWNAVAIDKLK